MHRVVQIGVFGRRSLPESTPGVKLTLKALYVSQEMDNVHVGVVLLGGNSGCKQGGKVLRRNKEPREGEGLNVQQPYL